MSEARVCARAVCICYISNDDVEPSANAHMHASHTHCPFRMSLSRKSGMPPAVLVAAPAGCLAATGSVGSAGSSGLDSDLGGGGGG